jgi:hypothetical protein
MVSRYRERLEQRDRLVFELIDSLLITYENIVYQQIDDGNSQNYTISNSQNPLTWIQSVLDENNDLSRQQNRILDVNDYIRMYSLQQHFSDVWSKVGDDFVTVYGGDEKSSIAQAIEQSIKEWELTSTQRMWSAIDLYLDINQIELSSFENKESFFLAIEAFIKNGQQLSENEILTTNGYSEYVKLADFWRSTFKNDWNLTAEDSRLLDSEEIAMIDVALMQWEEASRPIHPMLVAILSIMIVSLTGFVLVMIRSKATR